MTTIPHSLPAEESVVGQMLARPKCIGVVASTLLAPEHFYGAANATIYGTIIERFFSDEPVDPLSVAEACSKTLAAAWSVPEEEVVTRVRQLAMTFDDNAVEHAHIVKRHADLRALLDLAGRIQGEVERDALSPDQIAGMASSDAMRIATSAVVSHEIVSFADAGRNFIREMQRRVALRAAGYDVGVKFGIAAIDHYTKGLGPTELLIAGGEPGVGKSGLWWANGMKFAESQMARPADDRMGTLILSLEMGEIPSSSRWATALSGLESGDLRQGALDQQQMRKLVSEWKKKMDYPLFLNYASGLRLSQLRAIVSEAIRKHRVGLVIIDHFTLLFPDRHLDNNNQIDEERVIFLKNSIAKDLNVAVVCLAHTRKNIERADKRPRLSDLSGSGKIAAFADFVGLMFRPWPYASEKEQESGQISPNDSEMIWAKNRHDESGIGNFYFDPSRMFAV